MTQSDNSGYDLTPTPGPPKPGEPGWVPPVPVIEKAEPEPVVEGPSPEERADIEKNKGAALLAYVCFIIPILMAPTSKFARFHANQGLLSFIIWCVAIVGNVVLWLAQILFNMIFAKIDILRGFLSCVVYLAQPLLLAAALALAIYGIIQAANGEKKKLPVIGEITLIK